MHLKRLDNKLVELTTLLGDGHYHTPSGLCEALSIEPRTLRAEIKQLKDNHVKLEYIAQKGYVLLEPLILYAENQIKPSLSPGCELILCEEIESTHQYLKRYQRHAVCLAETQTGGIGRLGRSWYSPFANNIYFSYLTEIETRLDQLDGLSLVVSLAVVETLKRYALPQALMVKWPNDIIYAGQKLAGILIEAQPYESKSRVIISTGINVNMLSQDAGEIKQPWISIRQITGTYIDRNPLCSTLIQNLLFYLKKFQDKGLNFFLDEWKAVDLLQGKNVSLATGDKVYHGTVIGIDPKGHLKLRSEDGTTRTFSSGESSIVKSEQSK